MPGCPPLLLSPVMAGPGRDNPRLDGMDSPALISQAIQALYTSPGVGLVGRFDSNLTVANGTPHPMCRFVAQVAAPRHDRAI